MKFDAIWKLMIYAVAFWFTSAAAANRKARTCLQPALSGSCFGYVPSYAYNPFKRTCEEFVYGGCNGNENRFETRMACELYCRDI